MKPALVVALCGSAVCHVPANGAENLLQNGSFEAPEIKGTVRHSDGGHPGKAGGPTGWANISDKEDAAGGKLTVGLTDQIARTGKQSFYVDFEKLTAAKQNAILETGPIPVQPGQTYRISIWGRVDRDRPLALDERRPHMWVDVHYLKADKETDAAELQSDVRVLPGNVVPGAIRRPDFTSTKWSQYLGETTAPEEAAFATLSWSWVIPKDEGETDGVIYWDDAAFEEAPAGAAPAEQVKPAN